MTKLSSIGRLKEKLWQLRDENERLREALSDSNSLFAAMLLEKRPDEEIEAQITENNRASTLSTSDHAEPKS